MNIHFSGTRGGLQMVQSALSGKVDFVQKESAVLSVIEIDGFETLFSQPKNFQIPTFFFITTKDKKLFNEIKSYRISGILFPPLKGDVLMQKFSKIAETQTSQSRVEDYETLRVKIITKAESIPPLPAVVQDLLKLTGDSESEVKDIIDKIKMDQGLSSKVLKLVNSPFFGIRKEITSIDRGTVLLGVNTIKNLVMAISTQGFYNRNFAMYNATGLQIWLHGFTVARLCEELATMVPHQIDTESIYLAGLMHDIGKSVLVDFLVKEVNSPEEEQELLGVHHMGVAAVVLEKWGVADFIVEAVLKHHELETDIFGQILYYANLLDNMREATEDICKTISSVLGVSYSKLYPEMDVILREHVPENFPL